MKNKIKKFFRELPTSIFYTVVNPALVMGLGFLFISGSVRAEQLADWSGIRLFSLNGLLNYENALEFGSWYHAFLNEHHLIVPFFFVGMGVIIIRRYRQLRKMQNQKQRINKAVSLGFFEGLFLAVVLFGGTIGDIQTLFPHAISNTLFVLGIVIPSIGLSFCKGRIAEILNNFLDSGAIPK